MNSEEDIFSGYGVEITLNDPQDFLVIKETLTRIGVASQKQKKLYQSCHLLHKRGRYRIMHFKELFALDHKETDFSEQDLQRRNAICQLLMDWGLVNITDKTQISNMGPLSLVKVIQHKEKDQWQLFTKYSIGKKKYD